MRYIILALLLTIVFHSYANDTLTRREVFNLTVGDTFDYRISSHSFGSGPHGYYNDSSWHYKRLIISDVYYSQDSSVRFIARKQVWPLPVSYDTLAIGQLDTVEVYINNNYYFRTFILNDSSFFYFGVQTNYVRWLFPRLVETSVVGKGLGFVADTFGSGGLNETGLEATTLVYYSGVLGVLGTPYTSLPPAFSTYVSIQYINPDKAQIKIYPTISQGVFQVETVDQSLLPMRLVVYDLQGKEVKNLTLQHKKNEINAQDLSKGMYVWKVFNEQCTQTGKLVIE